MTVQWRDVSEDMGEQFYGVFIYWKHRVNKSQVAGLCLQDHNTNWITT
jgi:hypothetical protein